MVDTKSSYGKHCNTKYGCFHKTASSQPTIPISIKIYKCKSHTSISSLCRESIDRTPEIMYLGVVLDERLKFAAHISALSAKVRKVIGIMKALIYVLAYGVAPLSRL